MLEVRGESGSGSEDSWTADVVLVWGLMDGAVFEGLDFEMIRRLRESLEEECLRHV